MNDCIGWIIDGHMEKECVIKQSLVCVQVTLMAISNKHGTNGEVDWDQCESVRFQNGKSLHVI